MEGIHETFHMVRTVTTYVASWCVCCVASIVKPGSQYDVGAYARNLAQEIGGLDPGFNPMLRLPTSASASLLL